MLLRASGYVVKVAESGQRAIDVAASFKPDVVILDLRMPGMDGFDTAKALQQQAWSPRAVYIAHTAFETAATLAQIRQAGFHHYLRKPAAYQQFEEILANIPRGPLS